jgi:regulator of nonsense transcripts 3
MPANGQTNGVLPIAAAQTSSKPQKIAQNRSIGPKLKVVVRRLSPSLTEAAFLDILGDEWKVGNGKVDWFSYKQGKVSKEYVPTLLLKPN